MNKNRKMILAVSLMAVSLCTAGFSALPVRAAGETAVDQQPRNRTEVRVDNFTFSPEAITVPVNSAVTWVNKDDIPHVIASNDGLFKSKALDTDQQYSFTFTKPGTYAYYCSIHPKMVGKIVVR